MTIRVILVDDHPVVRTGLRAVLDAQADVSVVGEAQTGEEAVALVAAERPDVVLCDLRLGDGIDGVETTRLIRAADDPPAVIILTTFDRDADIVRSIEAGAAGYLLKDTPTERIVQAMREAAAGMLVQDPELSQRVTEVLRAPRVTLTAREHDVLTHLADGRSNRDIARALFISEATVKTHIVHILEKLDADSRGRAVSIARERGII